MIPKLLALDTSTQRLVVALAVGDVTHGLDEEGGVRASARLLPAVQELLQRAGIVLRDLDAVAFARGPGAFTGLRTAASAAQGLAFGLGCPVLPIDSLMVVAEDARLQALASNEHRDSGSDNATWPVSGARPPEGADSPLGGQRAQRAWGPVSGARPPEGADSPLGGQRAQRAWGPVSGARPPEGADSPLGGQRAQRAWGPVNTRVAVAMDARMGEIYAACWRWSQGAWHDEDAAALVDPDTLAARWRDLGPAVVAGTALDVYASRLEIPRGARAVATMRHAPAALASLARCAWHAGLGVHARDAQPLYVRDKVAFTTLERERMRAARDVGVGVGVDISVDIGEPAAALPLGPPKSPTAS